jgi:hypothetical protein
MYEKQKKQFQNLKIEVMSNGYLVHPNDNLISLSGTVREIPYVFETQENLFKFIEENFKILNQ